MEKQYIYLVGVSEIVSQSEDVIDLHCDYDNSCPMYAFLDRHEALSKYQELLEKFGRQKLESESCCSYYSSQSSPYVVCMEVGVKTRLELVEGSYYSPMCSPKIDEHPGESQGGSSQDR